MSVWVLTFVLSLNTTVYVKKISYESLSECLLYQSLANKYLERYDEVEGKSECKIITKI